MMLYSHRSSTRIVNSRAKVSPPDLTHDGLRSYVSSKSDFQAQLGIVWDDSQIWGTHMKVTIGPVNTRAREIEHLLKTNLVATGRSLHDQVTSVENALDPGLVRRLRKIATIDDKLSHEPGYSYDGDEDVFWRDCDAVIRALNEYHAHTREVTIEPVFEKTCEIEHLLKTNLGATGRGLHTLVKSVENVLDSDVKRRILAIATVRNDLKYKEGYSYPGDPDGFWRDCDFVIRTLKDHHRSTTVPASPPQTIDHGYGSGGGQPTYSQPPPQPETRPRPWYRSKVFQVIVILGLLSCLIAYLTLSTIQESMSAASTATFILGQTATPKATRPTSTPNFAPTATANHGGTATPIATSGARVTQGTPIPGVSAGCTIEWPEYNGDTLAGKNRYMVWDAVVKQQLAGSDITATQFYDLVADQNPSLKTDGYVFQKEKKYLLPKCK